MCAPASSVFLKPSTDSEVETHVTHVATKSKHQCTLGAHMVSVANCPTSLCLHGEWLFLNCSVISFNRIAANLLLIISY